jgi:hypothetical protein
MKNYLNSAIVVLIGLAGVPCAVHAQRAVLAPTVEAASSSAVTFSDSGKPTYAAFKIRWENTGGNTINGISATFQTSVVDGEGVNNPHEYTAPLFVAGNALPAGCVQISQTTFTCSIPQLKAGAKFPSDGSSFTVFYESPSKSPSDLLPPNTYSVKLNSTFLYSEGENGNNPVGQPSRILCEDNQANCPTIGLGTTNPTLVRSAVPKTGLALATGAFDSPNVSPNSGGYPFAAKVDVPVLGTVFEKPAEIELKVPGPTDPIQQLCTGSGQLATCRQATITIAEFSEGASPTGYLAITMRFAASEVIGKPVRPERIVVNYSTDGGLSNSGNANANQCSGFGTSNVQPPLQGDLRPCVANRVYYRTQPGPGYIASLAGVVELVFYVRQNGDWLSF